MRTRLALLAFCLLVAGAPGLAAEKFSDLEKQLKSFDYKERFRAIGGLEELAEAVQGRDEPRLGGVDRRFRQEYILEVGALVQFVEGSLGCLEAGLSGRDRRFRRRQVER